MSALAELRAIVATVQVAVVMGLVDSALVVLGLLLVVLPVVALVGVTVEAVGMLSGQGAAGQAAALTAAGSHPREGTVGGLGRSLVVPASAKRPRRRLDKHD